MAECSILDLGCGPRKLPGAIGIDLYPYLGVDMVRDLRRGLPFDDSRFDRVNAHHVLEHFDGEDLFFLVEEMWRVARPGGQLTICVPDLTSANRYRDPLHRTRDWSSDSFMIWEVDERGEWTIYVGPLYHRRAKLACLCTEVGDDETRNRSYLLKVIKL